MCVLRITKAIINKFVTQYFIVNHTAVGTSIYKHIIPTNSLLNLHSYYGEQTLIQGSWLHIIFVLVTPTLAGYRILIFLP